MTEDGEFRVDDEGLWRGVDLLSQAHAVADGPLALPETFPEAGLGSRATLEKLAPLILGGASRLGDPQAMAHMDPPTPWITWAMAMWNASLNQNLLHPATAPVARDIEERVVAWLAPSFGMAGGHMVPGSTISNLTAIWAARECAGVKQVVAGESAHISVAKAAHILGLPFRSLPSSRSGAVIAESVPERLDDAILVLTAGTTGTGAIDDLTLSGRAAWTHVDAAWAGPLRLSAVHAEKLDGLEAADSVAVSAHKWLFQPKDSALVLFRDVERVHAALSFGGGYLVAPNVGVLGSRGAAAVPLLATLLAFGRAGLASRIDDLMERAGRLAHAIGRDERLEKLGPPETGVVVWRPRSGLTDVLHAALPSGSTSLTMIAGERWLRNVAANPNLDVERLIDAIDQAASVTLDP